MSSRQVQTKTPSSAMIGAEISRHLIELGFRQWCHHHGLYARLSFDHVEVQGPTPNHDEILTAIATVIWVECEAEDHFDCPLEFEWLRRADYFAVTIRERGSDDALVSTDWSNSRAEVAIDAVNAIRKSHPRC